MASPEAIWSGSTLFSKAMPILIQQDKGLDFQPSPYQSKWVDIPETKDSPISGAILKELLSLSLQNRSFEASGKRSK